MPTRITRFVITALFASAMFAQSPASPPMDRVLHFTQAETDRELQEIATNIRSITEIPQVSIDAGQRTLALHGTAAQIALEPGTSWRHEQAARIYTSGELDSIGRFLRWRVRQ